MACPNCQSILFLSLTQIYQSDETRQLATQWFEYTNPTPPIPTTSKNDKEALQQYKQLKQQRAKQLAQYQRELSKKVAPPPAKRSPLVFALGMLAVINVLAQNHIIWSFILFVIAGYFYYQDYLYNKYVFKNSFEKWRKSVICTECHTTYLPQQTEIINGTVDFDALILERHAYFGDQIQKFFTVLYNFFTRKLKRRKKIKVEVINSTDEEKVKN